MGWQTEGNFERYDPNDPAALASEDQVRAGAHERQSLARTFLLFSVPADAECPTCDVSGVIEPEASHEEDTMALLRTMCQMIVRIWFERIDDRDEAAAAGIKLVGNVMDSITEEMHRKGIV